MSIFSQVNYAMQYSGFVLNCELLSNDDAQTLYARLFDITQLHC